MRESRKGLKIEAEMDSIREIYRQGIHHLLWHGADVLQQNVDSPGFHLEAISSVDFKGLSELFDPSGFDETFISQFGI